MCEESNYVELHVHLDGSLRHETIWELAQKKGLRLAGCRTLQDLRDACIVTQPKDLQHFLKPFCLFVPTIVNDLEAIERVAFEFCEDEARSGVVYVEVRYSPHFLLPVDVPPTFQALCEVVRAVQRGLCRGEQQYGLKARHILCALAGANMARDVLRMCEHLRDEGVVGMDVAAMASQHQHSVTYEEVKADSAEAMVFQEASRLGIHRTVHAGESGPAKMVDRAVEIYRAERIGHGYHVVDSPTIYRKCLEKNIHFETCPISSYLTGSVPLDTCKHPVVRFAEDDANFSISTDDPTVTGARLQDDYNLAWQWGLSEVHLARANLQAAASCFLPHQEKQQLVKQLQGVYGASALTHE